MDPISNVGQIVEILRKKLVDTQNKTDFPNSSNKAANTVAASAKPSIQELQKKIREKLKTIDPDDPKSSAKSIHIFLESVLLWEFGEKLTNDPKFYAMLDDIQQHMESDSAIRDDLTKLMSILK
jgi:hypothetical protein